MFEEGGEYGKTDVSSHWAAARPMAAARTKMLERMMMAFRYGDGGLRGGNGKVE